MVKGRAGLIDDDGNGLIRVSRIEACEVEWGEGEGELVYTRLTTLLVVL